LAYFGVSRDISLDLGINQRSQISRSLAVGRKLDRVQSTVLETNQNISILVSNGEQPPLEPPRPIVCPKCNDAMRHFTGKKDGQPWVKCDKCNLVRDPRRPFCYCGLNAKEYTSRTEKNYNRKFFGCPMIRDKQCKFFKWLGNS
jgi:hypothetical protein